MSTRLALLLLTIATCAASAQPPPSPARQEVDLLLARLAASTCEFSRNGDWHSPAAAREHLLRKLEYLERRTALTSAEQFIELAATRSSITGENYQVRCGPAAPMRSDAWLKNELRSLRALHAGARPSPPP